MEIMSVAITLLEMEFHPLDREHPSDDNKCLIWTTEIYLDCVFLAYIPYIKYNGTTVHTCSSLSKQTFH